MDLSEKTIVVTGAARGIGKALAKRLIAEGGKLVISDLAGSHLEDTAAELSCASFVCDVTDEAQVRELVKFTESQLGSIDILCSNAGLVRGEPDHAASASDQVWRTSFNVHVMAQVYAARAVLPSMIERREGYLVNMASAAGLLSQIGDAAYSATKHASVGFSESLAITHKDDGIRVSVVCPQYVATPMTGYDEASTANKSAGTLSAEEAATLIVEGMKRGDFMILTHPEVADHFRNKANDYNRWIGGMAKLRRTILQAVGSTRLEDMHKLM